jgi:hypothetical protein
MSAIFTITTDELAAVSGGHTPPQAAQEQVGNDWRCAYVETHLNQLGADEAFMKRRPRISPTSHFSESDLKDRLQMEFFYNCQNAKPVQ